MVPDGLDLFNGVEDVGRVMKDLGSLAVLYDLQPPELSTVLDPQTLQAKAYAKNWQQFRLRKVPEVFDDAYVCRDFG
jgi:hypothetical protein